MKITKLLTWICIIGAGLTLTGCGAGTIPAPDSAVPEVEEIGLSAVTEDGGDIMTGDWVYPDGVRYLTQSGDAFIFYPNGYYSFVSRDGRHDLDGSYAYDGESLTTVYGYTYAIMEDKILQNGMRGFYEETAATYLQAENETIQEVLGKNYFEAPAFDIPEPEVTEPESLMVDGTSLHVDESFKEGSYDIEYIKTIATKDWQRRPAIGVVVRLTNTGDQPLCIYNMSDYHIYCTVEGSKAIYDYIGLDEYGDYTPFYMTETFPLEAGASADVLIGFPIKGDKAVNVRVEVVDKNLDSAYFDVNLDPEEIEQEE